MNFSFSVSYTWGIREISDFSNFFADGTAERFGLLLDESSVTDCDYDGNLEWLYWVGSMYSIVTGDLMSLVIVLIVGYLLACNKSAYHEMFS